MKTVVITGVSTGIGLAAARAAVSAGFYVFGSVRNEADAARLTAELPHGFHPLIFDVTDAEGIQKAAHEVAQVLSGRTLDGLIQNAGIAVAGPLLHIPMDQIRKQFEVNVFSVVAIAQAFAPLLGADRSLAGKPGKIIHISSVAGKNGAPFVGAYAASKHALEGLSESMRRELMLYGIDVIVVGPGAVRTPIWGKAEIEPYLDTPYAEPLRRTQQYMQDLASKGFPPERCADLLVEILMNPSPATRHALVPQPLTNWWIPRLLPKRWLDAIIASRLGLKRQ
ncbi:MAG: SDR family NAD(P)-dependent oxidoreductase [Acidobacteria bacterium]|nr:SDR family NAD(P)-dependent oxidoreductase [Acidobacteriota bacterium]